MKGIFKKANFWMAATFVLAGVLAASFFFDNRPSLQTSRIKGQAQLVMVNTAELYKNLVCSCCGKSVADCECGMAEERRDFVDEQAVKGLDERGIFKEAVKKYGAEILFDQALAAEIKGEVVAEAPEDRPVISIEPKSIDLGDVSMAKGDVEAVFKVKNAGQSDLEISGMETSCGCTTAVLKIDGRESPIFGMSGNPTDWSEILKPGQEVELVATFDPNHHGPEGIGPATRTISVKSNDPIDSFKKVQFEVVVVE